MSAAMLKLPQLESFQPAKVDPVAAVGVRITGASLLKMAVQLVPQSIPAGLLVTVPLPAPALASVTTNC